MKRRFAKVFRSQRHGEHKQLLCSVFSVVSFSLAQLATPGIAQTPRQCLVRVIFNNQAGYQYNNGLGKEQYNGTSNLVVIESTIGNVPKIAATGIKDSSGSLVVGSVAGAISDELVQLGFSQAESVQGAIAVTQAWSKLSANPQISELGITATNAIIAAVPAKADNINKLGTTPAQVGSQLATRLLKRVFGWVSLTNTEATQATEPLQMVQTVSSAFQAMAQALPDKKDAISSAQKLWTAELNNIRAGVASGIRKDDIVSFGFTLTNTNPGAIPFTLPAAATLQSTDINGYGTVTDIKYQLLNSAGNVINSATTTNSNNITIPANGQAIVTVDVTVGNIPAEGGSIEVTMQNSCDNTSAEETVLRPPLILNNTALADPFGRVTSCTGGILPNYQGFSIGLYQPDPKDPTGGVTGLVALTGTELPQIPGSNIPKGMAPNTQNSNPFYLTNSDLGSYTFLLDKSRGQLDPGRTYILLVNPPSGSNYGQRRIRLQIGNAQNMSDGSQIVNYTATALDGLPITIIAQSGSALPVANSQNTQTSGQIGIFVQQGQLTVEDAASQGLGLVVVSLLTSVCEASEISITKTGDRASAQPGDTVIYRLSIRNLSDGSINNLVVTDNLPLGFQFRPDSTRGEMTGNKLSITSSRNGSTITLRAPGVTLPSNGVMTIAYAAVLTPDAFRGTGENSAMVNAIRMDNGRPVKDGPSVYQLRIRPGILSDTGTIIGKVFVDKKFDGEPQANEPGVPNAVILLDDGTRITTDANGLFSIANVLPGYHTGVLDLSSLPGYTLAPNIRFRERNSQSRLVRLEPGGLVRMNFGVIPTFKEGKQ